MILRCENCQTMYMFTESQLKNQGYKFACKKCGHENTVALPSDSETGKQSDQPIQPDEESADFEAGASALSGIDGHDLPREPGVPSESKEVPEEPPKETDSAGGLNLPEQEQKKTELDDIFDSLDISKPAERAADEHEPATAAVNKPEAQGADAESHGQTPVTEPAQETPSEKDEGVIEGFEEFTMDDIKGADNVQAEHGEETERPSGFKEQETGWLESTKIEEHPAADTGLPETGVSGETVPMDDTIPGMVPEDTAAATKEIQEPEAQADEHSILNEEPLSIPESVPFSEQPEEAKKTVPPYQKHLLKLLTVAGGGILVIVLVLLGIYYYLVEYTTAKPDFNKLTLMTYSVFPVSEKSKAQARQMLKDADALYLKDTTNDYKKSLDLYEKSVSLDHHLVDAYVGIAKDYVILRDRGTTKEELKNNSKFLSRVKSLLKDGAEYDLLQGMTALANNDAKLAGDKFKDALQKSPELPEALYYKASIDFMQGKPLTDTASALSRAIKLSPDMIKAQLLLAKVYQKQHESSPAMDLLKGILDRYPYNTSAAIRKADLQAGTISGVTQSISELNDMIHKGSNAIDAYDRADVYFTIGKLEMMSNNYSAAIDAFKNSLQDNGTSAVSMALGDAYLENGNLSDAEKQYQIAVSSDNGSAEAKFKLAHAYYLDHKYVLAIANYTAGLKLQNDNPQALFGLAHAREKNGELDSALEVIEKAVQMMPENPEFIVLNGRLLREKGNYKKASALLSQGGKRFPDYAPVHTEYGIVLKETGDYKDAIHELTTAMNLSPDAANTEAYMADVLNKTGKNTEAEKYALKALSSAKSFPYTYEVLGDIYLSERKLNDSIQSYKSAISLMPYDAEALYKLAQAYIAGGMFTDAAASLAGAIKMNPANALYHYTLGNVSQKTGNIQGAIDEYTKALDSDSTMADAYYQRGIMNISGRNDLAAVNDLKNAMKFAPENPDYILALANYYYNNKETYAAIDYLIKAIRIAPHAPELHYRLGVAYNYIGKTEDARKEFNAALSLSHDYANAMIGLGSIYYQQGDMQMAQQYYEKAIKLSPQNSDAYYSLGTVYEYNGIYERALEEYRYAAKLNTNNATAYFKMGMMLSNLNEPDKAKQALLKAVNLGLSSDMENVAKNKLRNLM